MNNRMKVSILTVAILFTTAGFARNTIAQYSIADTFSSEQGQQVVLGKSVKFYFGNQAHGPVVTDLGQLKVNKKTNAFMKDDTTACQWAFLSAMKSLKVLAQRKGANAVINIKSNYKNNSTSSDTQFTCGAGATIAGVALIGDAVRIDNSVKKR